MIRLQSIRSNFKEYLNTPLEITYDLGRNKSEILLGKIIKLYSRIFIFQLEDKSIRSFSYADYITKTIKIKKIK